MSRSPSRKLSLLYNHFFFAICRLLVWPALVVSIASIIFWEKKINSKRCREVCTDKQIMEQGIFSKKKKDYIYEYYIYILPKKIIYIFYQKKLYTYIFIK